MTDPLPRTEQRNPRSPGLGGLPAAEVIAVMNQEEHQVLAAIEQATPLLTRAAEHVAAVFAAGGRTVFLGAGTSGRIALQEAAELPPTFGVPQESFTVMAAGGALMGPTAITRDEDDVHAAPNALSAMRIGPGDAVIGLAASGTTPFVRAGLRAAARARAWTCGIAHNPGAPLLRDGDLGILLDTGPEVLTGSTQKLRARAVRIVMDLGGLDEVHARQRLEAAGWSVRAALQSQLRWPLL